MRIIPERGVPAPLGVTCDALGANVAVWSKHASRLTLCVYASDASVQTACFVLERQGDVHCAYIEGLVPGMLYGLRADGVWNPAQGRYFDDSKLLLDPYATELTSSYQYSDALGVFGLDTASATPRARVRAVSPDLPLRQSHKPGLIYELNVRSFTKRHPGIPEQDRGLVRALQHDQVIDHLNSLGADTVELMPLTAWIDERHLVRAGLRNAWGYNPISFFAPEPRLAPGGLREIRETITRLHEAGIGVILDIVLNHTGESDAQGPIVSFRGFGNNEYYLNANARLINDTGCGNTFCLNREPGLSLAISALRHWVLQAGVDGFRFDLATVLGRSENGFDPQAPFIRAVEADPVLSTRIMIAEPWDVGPGGYQLGNFPERWLQWNDRYRDDVRRFWRGDAGAINGFATRLAGSSDLFGRSRPSASVNFVAAHDGFTLGDLVKYSEKNNFANGENNQDGKSGEATWPAGNAAALLATLLFSLGTPMITAGDEFGRTQNGNNNAYAQDNETTWLDWAEANLPLLDLVRELVSLRRRLGFLVKDRFLDEADAQWWRPDGTLMNWQDADAKSLVLVVRSELNTIAMAFNAHDHAAAFGIPPDPGKMWKCLFSSAGGDATNLPPHSVAVFDQTSVA